MSIFAKLGAAIFRTNKPQPPPFRSRFGARAQAQALAGWSVMPKKGQILSNSGRLPVRASPPYIQQLSSWDTTSVLAALDAHMLGNFGQSGLLWQWMARDDRMQTVLRVRRAGLTTLPFSVQPASKKEATGPEIFAAEEMGEEWARCVPESFIRGFVDRAVGMGVAVARMTWVTGANGWWWPRLHIWPHEALRWDDFRRVYLARSKSGGEHVVKPGDGWLLWEPEGPRSFQLAAVLCLALPCLITSYDWRDWVNYNEAFGRPVRKAIVPRGATASEKATFLANLKALGRTTSSILCARNLDGVGFDFEFVTPQGDVTATFEKSIDRSDKAKATVILGQTMGVDTSAAVGMSTGDVRQQSAGKTIQGDAESLSTCLRGQMLEPWSRFNLGDACLAPWPCWETSPPSDKGKDALADAQVADAITKLDASTVGTDQQLDKLAYLEAAGIPLKARPPSEVPASSSALDLFKSEGLLGGLITALESSIYEVDLSKVLTQYGVPFKVKAPAPPLPQSTQDQPLSAPASPAPALPSAT